MLKVVTMKEIEVIFEVTDRLGLSREWVEIPLSPEVPGKILKLPNGKFEITVDAEVPIEQWVKVMETELQRLIPGGS
jgi:hypothetical protein